MLKRHNEPQNKWMNDVIRGSQKSGRNNGRSDDIISRPTFEICASRAADDDLSKPRAPYRNARGRKKKKKLFNFCSFRQRRLHFLLLWLLALRKEKLVTIFGHNGPSDCVGLVHSSASHSFAVRGTDASWVHTLLCSSSCHGCWRVKSLGAVVTSFLFV